MNDVNITIRIEQINKECATVVLIGRFDARNAQTVKETLKQLVDGGAIHLVVDLAQVPFVDSAGLAVLVSILKLVRRVGGSVLLAGVPPQARTVFSLTMLDQVFALYPTVQAALSSLDN